MICYSYNYIHDISYIISCIYYMLYSIIYYYYMYYLIISYYLFYNIPKGINPFYYMCILSKVPYMVHILHRNAHFGYA